MKKQESGFVFVAGNALLDIITTITEKRNILSMVGTTGLSFGGVAYNVAVNLQRMGVRTTLCTAMNMSPITQMILHELTREKIRSHIKIDASLPDAIYNGMIYQGEEIASAFHSNAEAVYFDGDFIRRGLQNASCMVINSCFDVDTMNRFIRIANEENVPAFVTGSSLLEAAKIKDIKGKIEYIFLNNDEMQILTDSVEGADNFADTSRILNQAFVVTKGGDGVEIYKSEGRFKYFATDKKAVTVNTLGAGDLFISAAIKGLFYDNLSIDDAIKVGLTIAPEILSRNDANMGRHDPVSSNIQMVTINAHKDGLTGALNRHGLNCFLNMPDFDFKDMYVLIIDADYFKEVNDNYGHRTGDEALISIVKCINEALRYGDITGRLGGEEFICFVQNVTKEQAITVAERIREKIANQKHTEKNVDITVSIGLSKYNDEETLDEIIEKADKALYSAKKQGRNKVIIAD